MPKCDCGADFSTNQQMAVHKFSAHQRVYTTKPLYHGSTAGYQGHKRRKETPCSKCLKAWRDYYEKKRSSPHDE